MLNSKEVAKSQMESNRSYLHDRFSLVPKGTSTPVNSHGFASQTQLSPAASAKQGTPRRYSLSALSTPSTSRSTPRYQQCQGPLLTSLNYKDNVSMYEETKSCGLAKRIVLYNEEAEEERRVTHQQRYNGLGLFPVVHLFKQQSPVLGPSLKRVKVKLSSPEYLRLCPPEEKRKLLKDMTKPQPAFKRQISLPSHSSTPDIGTKSVLDALKEISRKRIHSEEEHDFPEEWGKRMKTHIPNGAATPTSKRARADSPLEESPTSPTLRQTKKKICVYDEFTASKSSSDLSTLLNFEPPRIKRKTISTSTESLIAPKHVKLVNVETQTIIPVSESKPEPPAPVSVQEDSRTKHANSSIKVFDDARLDRIRKSRLAALMGNLAGKDAALPLKQLVEDEQTSQTVEQDKPKTTENTTPAAPKAPLVSSLAPATRSSSPLPVKQDRHVHFNVPAPITSQAEPLSVPTSITPAAVGPAKTPTSSQPTFSINFADSKAKADLPASSSAFASPVSTKVPTESLNASTPLALSFSKPSLSTSNASEKLPSTPPVISKKTSPSKPGGFKFDLKAPAATPPTTSQNSLALPSADSFIFNKPEQKALSFGNEAQSNAGFGLATATNSFNTAPAPITPAFNFGTSTNDLKFGNFASKSPAAGSVPTTSDSDGQRLSFAAPAAAQNSVKLVPSTGFGGSVPASTAPLFGANQTSGFGAPTVSSTANSSKFGFGSNQTSNAFPSATSVVSFGTTTPASTFGNVDATNFGAPATTLVSFGASSVPPSASFGAPSTTHPSNAFGVANTLSTSKSFGAPSATLASNAFGVPNKTSALSPFGAPSATAAASAFATPTTTAAGFGASSFNMPTFSTSQSAFGAPKLTPSVTAFGDVTLAVSPALNSSNMLGKTTQAPMFGSGTNSAFGAPVQPSSSVFGAAATKSSNPPPPYGTSVFSAQSGTSAPAFKANSTPAFSFGANKTENAFGASTTTTPSVFGAPTSFTSTSGFGSGAPTFGTTTTPSTFGAAPAPSFGQTDNKPAFTFGGADAKPSSIFGSGSANSFGKPANTASTGFGSTGSNVFGSSNPASTVNTQQPAGGFNFGSNALPTSTPFAFGPRGSTEPAKPSFSFTGQSPATFGSSSVQAPPFGGAASTPNFSVVGAAPQQPGVFNIGTGSGVKQRAQLRAKRRT
ncbi:nuclear pore complex protein DDB_G0274915 [Dendroctonus ponderosae]|uniref:nuclear pore complex protein DDB_G0274915 n=1 Tax=Dendroctonus ponderosae TaxID=77166 RepID=UPI0020366322|nr:nuclear pore complex protein DDB_G0274915 [Dendroctonus ponderosae]KAH1024684.1 hypothetical protein HUJ05_004135 [Dendroctonus ponderosae]